MCGLAGFIKRSTAQLDTVQILQTLSQSIPHRGPDAAGFGAWKRGKKAEINHHTALSFSFDSPDVAFIHRRLSIIDTSTNGHQPVLSDDGRYMLIQNGEIYNYIELRKELISLGHQFHSEADTEVLLKSYIEWGNRAFNKFIGMFAVCILDTKHNELTLVRDFFGIKPLFYSLTSKALVFGSEIKALLNFPGMDKKANLSSVRDYLSLGLVNHNQESFYSTINSLEPGHYLTVKLDRIHEFKSHKYYTRSSEPLTTKDLSFEEAAQHLRDLFFDSVKLHMRSDVPYGAALSGGVDSSAITAVMRSINGNHKELKTFTYSTKDTAFDEERYADLMIDLTQAKAYKALISPIDLRNEIDVLLNTQDEPFGSTSIYAQYKVFEEAKNNGIKVILGGQGADEILGGYRSYYTAAVSGMIRSGRISQALQLIAALNREGKISLANFLLRLFARLCPPSLGRQIHRHYAQSGISSAVNWQWFNNRGINGRYSNLPGTANKLEKALEVDFTSYNLPGLLRYEDRNSMAHSIESRVPFLTPDIVEFVGSLPPTYLIDKSGCDKAVFRAAMRNIVPDDILDRKDKIGFQTPEKNWFTELAPWIREIITGSNFKDIPFFDAEKVLNSWQMFEQGKTEFPRAIWRWVNLARWAELNGVQFNDG